MWIHWISNVLFLDFKKAYGSVRKVWLNSESPGLKLLDRYLRVCIGKHIPDMLFQFTVS
jgi:hypothetical protein